MKNLPTTRIPYFFAFMTLPAVLLCGCVSVQLPTGKAIHSQRVEFRAPEGSFSEIKTDSADKAWQSQKTGNTIFYISDCNPNSDPELSELANDTLNAMSEVKPLETHDNEIYNDRAALEIVAKGRIDGVSAKIWVLVFKKDGCSFTLSLTGSEKTVDSERSNFENFKKNFKVRSF